MQCAICEKDMFRTDNPSQGPIVCGSCVMTPLPSPEDEDIYKSEDSDYDLSYLDDTEERQRPEKKFTKKKGKYYTQVQTDLTKMVTQQPVPLQEVEPVNRFKVKSNSLRDRAYPIGDMVLHFDGEGVAEVPEYHLEAVKTHMRLRPGRFRLLDTTPKPKKDTKSLDDARAALEAAKAEKEPEPKVDDKSPTEATPEAPKAQEESKSEEESKPTKVETSDKTSKPKASRKTTSKSSKTKKSEES